MPATVAGILLGPDTHANRPAANASGLPVGSLYVCSDHNLIYQTDGSAWSTWWTGAGIVAAEDVTIADAGAYFTGTDVEAALQELGAGGGGGGGTTSPHWWHSDNAPASPNAANREFTAALSDTRVSHGTPKGTWAVVNDGAEFTQTATGATDLDVWAIPDTISIGDYVTIYGAAPFNGVLLGMFVGFSDGTTFGTSDAVGVSHHQNTGIHQILMNTWTNFNSRLSDGTVRSTDTRIETPLALRVKYEAANTWGLYYRLLGGQWRTVQTNYSSTLTPTHLLYGVSMTNSPTFTAGNGVRLEMFRKND